jgi:uncharacterized protein (DUF433 family)
MTSSIEAAKGFWRERLNVPAYQVVDAARYARISVQTAANWQSKGDNRQILSSRQDHASLSYFQLIELAVVAEFRKLGVKLAEIRDTREYVSSQLKSKHPFAEFKFKTDGKALLLAHSHFDKNSKRGDLVETGSRAGQLAWEAILNKLTEFDYEKDDVVVRWRVCGNDCPVVIDPRLSFGAPSVKGVPTWVIKGRWEAREEIDDIAEDFNLDEYLVREALKFENVDLNAPLAWLN